MLLTALLVTATLRDDAPRELYDYLRKPDPSYAYQVHSETAGREEILMTSQTWQGIPWRHTILFQQPAKSIAKGTAILYITGDGPRPGDMLDLALLSGATSLPIAMLFDEPNQPLWDKKEDDLLAYTFTKYLETKDPTWPGLFPMTKAALRAMDTIEEVTKNDPNPIHRFVVTGASKRGWTTWLVGASKDPRVVGIAPMVYDNLNLPAQMRHQMENWGHYSDSIKAYTMLGLQAQLATPLGARLGRMVDPFSYRKNIHVPTLIVNGANDPYWSADSTSLYWDALPEPHWLLTVPNAGHTLGDQTQAVESVGAFSRSLAGEFKMPKLSWQIDAGRPDRRAKTPGRPVLVRVSSDGPGFETMRVWAATSDDLDFRPAHYDTIATVSLPPAKKPGRASSRVSSPFSSRVSPRVLVSVPEDKNVALFAEVRYRVGDRQFSLCTPTKVFRKK